MNTPEQLSQMVLEHTRDIVALKESSKLVHKRIDATEKLTSGIHELAANMKNLTEEVKRLGERLENGLREQGKRIGETESAIIRLENVDAAILRLATRLEKIEKEPGDKWKQLTAQVFSLVVAAVVGGIIAFIFK